MYVWTDYLKRDQQRVEFWADMAAGNAGQALVAAQVSAGYGHHTDGLPCPRRDFGRSPGLTLNLVEGSEFQVWRARCAASGKWPGTAD
jgi:hypothetical protein